MKFLSFTFLLFFLAAVLPAKSYAITDTRDVSVTDIAEQADAPDGLEADDFLNDDGMILYIWAPQGNNVPAQENGYSRRATLLWWRPPM